MQKKYIVRLTDQERDELHGVIKKRKGTAQKVRRAQILLKADSDGPNWTDEQIAEAFAFRTRTVEKIRQRLVERGFEETLHGVERAKPLREETEAWSTDVNAAQRGVDWQMKIDDARTKLKSVYPKIKL
jgi:hypothetical protein